MGVDICMYVKTSDGQEPYIKSDLPDGCGIEPIWEQSAIGDATHEILVPWRYYSPDYERGPWPWTACILMMLYDASNVETVWYYGDCGYEEEPFTPEKVAEYSLYYMKKEK